MAGNGIRGLLPLLLVLFAGNAQASLMGMKGKFRPVHGALETFKSDYCPDISGTFLCRENTYRTDTYYQFSRSFEDQVWVYDMRTFSKESGAPLSIFQFRADGSDQTVVDKITGQRLQLTASCQQQILAVRGEFRTPTGATIYFSEDLSLDPDGNLSNVSLDIQGRVVTEICERK